MLHPKQVIYFYFILFSEHFVGQLLLRSCGERDAKWRKRDATDRAESLPDRLILWLLCTVVENKVRILESFAIKVI